MKYKEQNRMRRIAMLFVVFTLAISASALEECDTMRIYYHLNDSLLDSTLSTNGQVLDRIDSHLKVVEQHITDIKFAAGASPEGSTKRNAVLARKRANTLFRHIREYIPLDEEATHFTYKGSDWEGLLGLMQNDEKVPMWKEAQQIIKQQIANPRYHTRSLNKLKALDGGRTYAYLRDNYFNELRSADVIIQWQKSAPVKEAVVAVPEPVAVAEPEPVVAAPEPEPVVTVVAEPAPEPAPEPVWQYPNLYLKTNAAGWGLLIANAAVEYEMANHEWSFTLPIYYSGWNYFSDYRKFRCFAVQPEARYWVKPVKGLFVGAHVGMAYYNFAKADGEFRYQDRDGKAPLFNAGLSAGYRVNVGKSGNWKLEFSVGAGYVTTTYDRFFNIYNGKKYDTVGRDMIVIDQVNLSVVYRLPWQGKGKRVK